MDASTSPSKQDEGLRERNVPQAVHKGESSSGSSGQDTPAEDEEAKEMKTFGRTPDGTSEYWPHKKQLNEGLRGYTG